MPRLKSFLAMPAIVSLTAPVLAQQLLEGIELGGFLGGVINAIGIDTFNYIIAFIVSYGLTVALLGALPFMTKVRERPKKSASALISTAVGLSTAVYVFINKIPFLELLAEFFLIIMLVLLALIVVTFIRAEKKGDIGKIKWKEIGLILIVIGIGISSIFKSVFGYILLVTGGIIMLVMGGKALSKDVTARFGGITAGKRTEEELEAQAKKLTTKDADFIKSMEELDQGILKEENNIKSAVENFRDILVRALESIEENAKLSGRFIPVGRRPIRGASYREVVRQLVEEANVILERIGGIGKEEERIYGETTNKLKLIKQLWRDYKKEVELWKGYESTEAWGISNRILNTEDLSGQAQKLDEEEARIDDQIARYEELVLEFTNKIIGYLEEAAGQLKKLSIFGIQKFSPYINPEKLTKTIKNAIEVLDKVKDLSDKERRLILELETLEEQLKNLKVEEITEIYRTVRVRQRVGVPEQQRMQS